MAAALAALWTTKDRAIRVRLWQLEHSLDKDGARYAFRRRTVIDAAWVGLNFGTVSWAVLASVVTILGWARGHAMR